MTVSTDAKEREYPLAKRTTTKTKKADPGRKLAIEAARIAADSHSEDIVVLDLRGRSPVTDYYVIATGSSDRQMRSVAEDIAAAGKKIDMRVWHIAGLESSSWILLDFVDVVVHLFDDAHRHYYDLELLWGDAPRVRWKRPVSKAKTDPTEDAGEDE